VAVPERRKGPDFDTRHVAGVIRLLCTPNDGTGRLATRSAEGDDDDNLESLREAARRAFYLLTLREADAALRNREAERRVLFFIQSMYMHQMPDSPSVLEMPAFNVVTPIYAEG
jgi:hypothetical protein